MIDAKELRIGNVTSRGIVNEIFTFVDDEKAGRAFQTEAGCIFFLDYTDPILLTAEILEKCGFENNSITCSIAINNKSYIYFDLKSKEVGIAIKSDETGEGWIIIKVSFVHQIQNLYFCLTGTELTVNL